MPLPADLTFKMHGQARTLSQITFQRNGYKSMVIGLQTNPHSRPLAEQC
jgi:hypothetical protein